MLQINISLTFQSFVHYEILFIDSVIVAGILRCCSTCNQCALLAIYKHLFYVLHGNMLVVSEQMYKMVVILHVLNYLGLPNNRWLALNAPKTICIEFDNLEKMLHYIGESS